MKLKARSTAVVAGFAVGAIALAGCGAQGGAPEASATPDASASAAPAAEKVNVVASTNIYGQLASQIGGDFVEVTSIIDSVTVDPHTYEASAQDKLLVEQAQLVINNGGGYDAYIDTLLVEQAQLVINNGGGYDAYIDTLLGDRDVERVIAVESSHDDHDHADDEHAKDDHAHDDDHAEDDHDHEGHTHIEGLNEHVWFDAHTMIHVVEEIAEDLAELDPANASVFSGNAATLIAELEAAEAKLADLKTQVEGEGVFMTEPLPGYLAEAAGLADKTPEGFAEAVEEGSDVAPATMLAASNVIENKEVKAVLANEQTSDAATQQIVTEADAAGINVARFTELLNPGQTYIEWLLASITSLETAVK